MLHKFSIIVLLTTIFNLSGQGLIINEFSNGPSGSQEWVELLVIGDSSSPSSPVDLTNWILDDNGGNFEGSISGVGIADGHIVFSSSFNAVPPGSLIVIYFNGNKSVNLPLDDPADANNDSVYILPGNHSSLRSCTSVPSIGSFSYSCSPTTADWSYITLRNGGDAIQVRMPTNNLFHGYAYGDVSAPFPLFFPSNQSSWNIGNGGTGYAYPFDCGDWEDQSAFNEINEALSTPGLPNTANNATFISRLKDGTFDYQDRTNNCAPTTIPPSLDTTPQKPVISIPNVFSPNGDGDNDIFTIDSLEYYDTKNIEIYNRWGNIVYTSNNYQNDWGGKTNEGSPLNQGTYYYILDIGEEKKRAGFVSLFK